MSAPRWVLAALAVAALAPVGCSDGGPGEGEARLAVDGRAVVERADGQRDVVHDDADLGPGDRVELVEGTGTLALKGGTRLELRAGVADAAASMVRMAKVPEVEAGDVLVSTPGKATLRAAGTTFVVDDGAAQVSRALGVGVAVYDAEVRLDSAGQERAVPALREMRVPALGRPPQVPKPLAYDDHDPWDRRFLGAAIDLGDRLEALAQGYTSNLRPGEGRSVGFFRMVLPGLDGEPRFSADLIDLDRPPGETLVGAAITDMGRRGDFAERWESVFRFRDQGARWGLVALDQAVSGEPLLGAIEDAVSASPLEFALPPTSPSSSPTATPPPATGEGQGTAPPTTVAPSPTTTGAPPPTTTPTTPPPLAPLTPSPSEPLTPALEPVVEPATELITGLVDGLLGALRPPSGG